MKNITRKSIKNFKDIELNIDGLPYKKGIKMLGRKYWECGVCNKQYLQASMKSHILSKKHLRSCVE